MSNTYTYGTISASTYGMSVTPAKSEDRPKTPPGLFATNAVQTKDGWLAQVIVDKQIVFEELVPEGGAEKAMEVANAHVVETFRSLFAKKECRRHCETGARR